MGRLSRPFNDAARFEREKLTRIVPDAFYSDLIYTLRIKWPFQGKEFGREFAVLLEAYQPNGELLEVELAWQPGEEVEFTSMPFSLDGFLITAASDDESADVFAGHEFEVMGYLVGSTDPWDIALAEMTQQLTVRA